MKLIKFKQLQAMLGGSTRQTIARWERNGTFPKRLRMGPRSIAWYEHEVVAYLATRRS